MINGAYCSRQEAAPHVGISDLPLMLYKYWYISRYVSQTVVRRLVYVGPETIVSGTDQTKSGEESIPYSSNIFLLNPYPTAFPYGNGMVLHFYQQQESSTTKTVHKVINKGLKTYV